MTDKKRPICDCGCPKILVAGVWVCPIDMCEDHLFSLMVTQLNRATDTQPTAILLDDTFALECDNLENSLDDPDCLLGKYIVSVSEYDDGNTCITPDGYYGLKGVSLGFYSEADIPEDILPDADCIHVTFRIDELEYCFNHPLSALDGIEPFINPN